MKLKLFILIICICISLIIAGCGSETMWLKVIDKQIYPRWINGFSNKYAIIMENERHQIIITYNVELFYLVEVNDIINAKVDFCGYLNSVKYYLLSDVEFLNKKEIFNK